MMIFVLVHAGANVLGTDNEGLTALAWACTKGHISCVQLLLQAGATAARQLEEADKSGRTPLHLAAFNGNADLVQLLIERGAVVDHVDKSGMRPLDRAICSHHMSVVQRLLRRGAKLGTSTWTAAAGQPDIILVLLYKLVEDGTVLYKVGFVELLLI